MALTIGLVHSLSTGAAGGTVIEACAHIGPAPGRVEIMALTRQVSEPARMDAFKVSMLNLLIQAFASGREVVVGHEDSDAYILSVELR